MKAIERIAGYACEVNEEQWRELVKVADEVGCPVDERSRKGGVHHAKTGEIIWTYAKQDSSGNLYTYKSCDSHTLIPYPDFLAKLKGDEKWEPKNGDEVEVTVNGVEWIVGQYIGKHTHDVNVAFVFDLGGYRGFDNDEIRKLTRPTITRAEAEQKLKELGVIARIVD